MNVDGSSKCSGRKSDAAKMEQPEGDTAVESREVQCRSLTDDSVRVQIWWSCERKRKGALMLQVV
jgi:hypothetical protein